MILRNIVITGFMGTGKSTVGRALSREIGFRFVDMDTLLEAREGRVIREIFTTEGEPYFRQRESEMCRELAMWRGYVISTGGGTLVSAENQAAFDRGNLVICLDCEPEALWVRLAAAENRPMLDSDDRKTRLLGLLQERQPAYNQIKHHIDSSNRPIEDVVADIMALWEQQTTPGG